MSFCVEGHSLVSQIVKYILLSTTIWWQWRRSVQLSLSLNSCRCPCVHHDKGFARCHQTGEILFLEVSQFLANYALLFIVFIGLNNTTQTCNAPHAERSWRKSEIWPPSPRCLSHRLTRTRQLQYLQNVISVGITLQKAEINIFSVIQPLQPPLFATGV